MGQHHRREDVAVAPRYVEHPRPRHHLEPRPVRVPHDAPPAGLGYPDPTTYRPHPVTGVPTPPRSAVPVPAPRRPRTAATRVPLAVAIVGTSMALVGMGSQLPELVQAVASTTASAPSPAVARQCASVVAGALDDTVARTPSGQWPDALAARGDDLAATYGETSPEHRAYSAGADEILAWMRAETSEDYTTVTTRVARTVATTCGT